MRVIGITGPTGCGKTTLLHVIARHGGYVIDCDGLYYEMLRENTGLREALRETFGEVFHADGTLERAKLGALVFSDPAALERLNGIVYHYMGQEIAVRLRAALNEGRPYAAIDAINLVESGFASHCEITVAVLAPRAQRLARIMARDGISEDYARKRIDAQKPDEFYRSACDVTLENGGTQEEFEKNCEQWLIAIE